MKTLCKYYMQYNNMLIINLIENAYNTTYDKSSNRDNESQAQRIYAQAIELNSNKVKICIVTRWHCFM